MAKQVKPSARRARDHHPGASMYLKKRTSWMFSCWAGTWPGPTGTMDSLVEAADFVLIEKRQGIKISAPEDRLQVRLDRPRHPAGKR